MTETAAAVDCVTIQMEAEEPGGEAAESTSTSKTQLQVMQLLFFLLKFFKIKFHGIWIFNIGKK